MIDDRAAVDAALAAASGRYLDAPPGPVNDAMRYALAGPGKRFRGVLLLMVYRACGGPRDASPLAAAVEIVHAYSLVHDDLPCMDDDDVRRGRATTHRVHGVPAATAAGVAMVPLAVRVTLDAAAALSLPSVSAARCVALLMRASGAAGMVGGQLLDLEAEGRASAVDDLQRIHAGKTGALVSAAAGLGGIAAGAGDDRVAVLEQFGAALGLAFQIADDVLDVTATTAALGKTAGRDAALGKSTYPGLLGVDGATARARTLVAEGCAALDRAGLLTPELEAVARSAVERQS